MASQDVYDVAFSPYQPGELVSSGTGHIRFWKMAETFTGTKLQGALGKFGKVDLSDVYACAEFPDGKVLSGSEPGQLLVWDGEFIKLIISQADGKPAHDGNIVTVYKDENEIVTAGVDGFIKIWDYTAINEAELSDTATVMYIPMKPKRTIFVGEGVSIRHMARRAEDWLVQDANGALWIVPYDAYSEPESIKCLMSFHAGAGTPRLIPPGHLLRALSFFNSFLMNF